MSDAKQSCKTCKFFRDEDGACRRYPPTAMPEVSGEVTEVVTLMDPISAFPLTHPDDWCGEWRGVKFLGQ